MRKSAIVAMILLVPSGVWAQSRGAASAGRPSGSVARPAAPAASAPRNVGSALYPAGAVPPINSGSPFINTSIPGRVGVGRDRFRSTRSNGFVYTYPIYVGGSYYGGYGSYYDSSYAGGPVAPAGGSEQPNVVVVYPPQQPPVIINQFGPGDPRAAGGMQPQNLYPMPEAPAQAESPEAAHYIIAFKDHSIFSAVAYWVDGDTLHYFTTPTTHNQASVALVDRELTDRLNKESGVEVKLPPAK